MVSHKKLYFYILFFFLIAGCSVTSDVHLSLIVPEENKESVNLDRAARNASSNLAKVSGKSCHSRTAFPAMLNVNMDHAVKNALIKAPGAIALEDVDVTQKVNSFFVYNRVCTEVKGLPVYSLNQAK